MIDHFRLFGPWIADSAPRSFDRPVENLVRCGVPSPVGHALGGLIVGELLAPSALLLCAIAGVAPDVDFLWGRHNMETHSLFAGLLAGILVFAWNRNGRLALAVTLAWASHVLFDWLGSDTTPWPRLR